MTNREHIFENKGQKMFSDHYIDYFELPEIYDPKYLEIDDFKDYEYNNNIAYEFAIRNNKVLQALEKFEKQFQKYEKEHQDLSQLVDYINMDHFRFLQEAGFDLFAMTYWLFKKRANQVHELSNLTNDELCERCSDVLNKKENHVLYEKVKPLLILFNPAFESGKILEGLSCKYVKIKGQNITEIRKNHDGRISYLGTVDPFWNPTGWSSDVYREAVEDDILPSIRYSFKRPLMRIIHYNALFNLPVNLEMDKTQFIDYMTKIKDEYDERKKFDLDERKRLEDERQDYIRQSSNTAYEKRAIANTTIKMYEELNKHKHRVFTTTDLFGGTYIHPEKIKYLEKLTPNNVKKLLYIWDSLKSAETYNTKLNKAYQSYKDNNQNRTISEKKEDDNFYKSQIISERFVLDKLYQLLIEDVDPVPKNHTIYQRQRRLKKLIDNLEYKFLI